MSALPVRTATQMHQSAQIGPALLGEAEDGAQHVTRNVAIEQIRPLGLSAAGALWRPEGWNDDGLAVGTLSHGHDASTGRMVGATAIGLCLFLLTNVALQAAIGDNLVSCWTLDEASGTRNDSAASANHLTDNNTVGSAAGKIGNAADFEKDNSEYLSHVSNGSLQLGDQDWTIVAWVNAESVDTVMVIVAKDNEGDTRDYDLDIAGAFRAGFVETAADGGSNVTAFTGGSASTATWYFVVGWHDAAANTMNVLINDGAFEAVASVGTSGAIPPTSASEFQIGSREGTTFQRFFDGLIDEVAIWKRALTTGEMTDLYNSGTGRACSYIVPAGGPTSHPNRNFIGFTR